MENDWELNLSELAKYHVYRYEHIDMMMFLIKPSIAYGNTAELNAAIEFVKGMFEKAGWEGDGDIELIWLPPFVDNCEYGDTYGALLWHVKQSNNGTSFIASPIDLTFLKPIAEQI